jgi:hypothetical protein
MSVSARVIRAIAAAMIDRHGIEAAPAAARRAAQRARLGDPEGAAA